MGCECEVVLRKYFKSFNSGSLTMKMELVYYCSINIKQINGQIRNILDNLPSTPLSSALCKD